MTILGNIYFCMFAVVYIKIIHAKRVLCSSFGRVKRNLCCSLKLSFGTKLRVCFADLLHVWLTNDTWRGSVVCFQIRNVVVAQTIQNSHYKPFCLALCDVAMLRERDRGETGYYTNPNTPPKLVFT